MTTTPQSLRVPPAHWGDHARAVQYLGKLRRRAYVARFARGGFAGDFRQITCVRCQVVPRARRFGFIWSPPMPCLGNTRRAPIQSGPCIHSHNNASHGASTQHPLLPALPLRPCRPPQHPNTLAHTQRYMLSLRFLIPHPHPRRMPSAPPPYLASLSEAPLCEWSMLVVPRATAPKRTGRRRKPQEVACAHF